MLSTAPLSLVLLKKIKSKPGMSLVFSYKSSRIKGSAFINYIANLKVDFTIELSELNSAELGELLNAYMMTQTEFNSTALNNLCYCSVIKFVGDDNAVIADQLNIVVPEGFYDFFISQYEDTLARYFIFLSSMLKYCDYVRDTTENRPHDLSLYHGKIDNKDYVGVNLVNLFNIDGFFQRFYSLDLEAWPQIYFPVQFHDPIYKGGTLLDKFFVDNKMNWLFEQRMFEVLSKEIETTLSLVEPAPGLTDEQLRAISQL